MPYGLLSFLVMWVCWSSHGRLLLWCTWPHSLSFAQGHPFSCSLFLFCVLFLLPAEIATSPASLAMASFPIRALAPWGQALMVSLLLHCTWRCGWYSVSAGGIGICYLVLPGVLGEPALWTGVHSWPEIEALEGSPRDLAWSSTGGPDMIHWDKM